MLHQELREGLTYDDLLLLPQASDVLPFSNATFQPCSRRKSGCTFRWSQARWIPSPNRAPRSRCAQVGGIGIVHRNLTVEQQAAEVETVKKYESGMITDPVTVHPDQKIGEALRSWSATGSPGFRWSSRAPPGRDPDQSRSAIRKAPRSSRCAKS